MSSDHLYVGSFGRLLPLPESSTPPAMERPKPREVHVLQHKFQLPPPKIPSPLQFSTDPMSPRHAPRRFNHRPRMHAASDAERPTFKETLPSVSQLLTPASHSSVPASPFSPQNRNHSPSIERSLQSSPVREQYDRSSSHLVPQGHQFSMVPLPYNATRSNFPLIGPQSSQQAATFPTNMNPRPWSVPEQRSFRRKDSSTVALDQQTVPYHQGQLPYQSVVSNGVSRSPTFHNRLEQSDSAAQRIPRVVAEEHIHGEGLCYIYEDGSHCRKMIDGEAVNASWGVTKAGKPRKRLAQACMTCREKKIKCDPNTPKCVQCQKFGRECRFESAPRGNHPPSASASYREHSSRLSQSDTLSTVSPKLSPNGMASPSRMASPSGMPLHNGMPSPSGIPAPSGIPSGSNHLQRDMAGSPSARSSGDLEHVLIPQSPKTTSRDRGQEETRSPKRRRMGSSGSSESTMTSKGKDLLPKTDFEPAIMTMEGAAKTFDPVLEYYQKDPYALDPELTIRNMDLYFTHVNQATYCMFPRKPFLDWLQSGTTKSAEDIMVVWAMIAMGSIFASPGEAKSDSRLFCNILRQAIQQNFGRFSLQLVQSRLLVALLHFALGESGKAWDYCGSALRAACALNFNIEEGVNDLTDDQVPEYGLSKAALAECQRRTFWSAYLMDRFNGFCSGHLSIIHNHDIFLRLPCPEDIYESNSASESPFFYNEILDPKLFLPHNEDPMGSMAYLALVSSAWGEVLHNIYRIRYHRLNNYESDYEAFHANIQSRLNIWMSSLPQHLVYSESNIDLSIKEGYIGTFISLQTLYHTTLMKLHRHVRHESLSQAAICRNFRAARHHALELLRTTSALAKVDRQKRLPATVDLKFAFSTPFTGYAIFSAVEILSAAGLIRHLPEDLSLFKSGLCVVEELADFWFSARGQRKAIQRRLEDVGTMAISQVGKIAYRAMRPMETTFGIENDLLYTMGNKEMFEAIGLDGIDEQKIAAVAPSGLALVNGYF